MNQDKRLFGTEGDFVDLANQPHPDEDVLELYALGRLGEDAAAPIEEHILFCEDCRVKLDELTDFAVVMREAASNVATAGPLPNDIQDPVQDLNREPAWKRFFRMTWLPVPAPAFAVAMIALLAVVVWQPWASQTPSEWQSLELRATRGESAAPSAVEGKGLRLSLDANGIAASPLTISIVRADGTKIVSEPVSVANDKVNWEYPASLAPGAYWVRLHNGTELMREFALPVAAR